MLAFVASHHPWQRVSIRADLGKHALQVSKLLELKIMTRFHHCSLAFARFSSRWSCNNCRNSSVLAELTVP